MLASGAIAQKKKNNEIQEPPAGSAAAVVVALYRDHFAHEQNWTNTFERNKKLFAPALLELFDENDRLQAANPDEVVGLDFDPLTSSQELADSFRLGGTTHEGQEAVVTVAVAIGGESRNIRIRLVPAEASSWLVSNIIYDEGDLASILSEPL
jgi:hypothetical protein